MKHLVYSMLAGLHGKRALRQLRMLEGKLFSQQARFAVPFVYHGHGYFKSIEPRQNSAEIEELYKLVCELAPERTLEIGTAKGGTLYLWTRAASSDATIVSVDLPGGEFGGAYPSCRIPFYQSFARSDQKLHLLRADSHHPQTLQRVREFFDNQPIDFLFIDGDHSYDGVRADFLHYGPLVRPGGLIAFHDILPRPDIPEIGVDRFWAELRQSYETVEVIGPEESGRKIGIGLIRVGKSGVGCHIGDTMCLA